MLTLIRRRRERAAARDIYFAAEKELGKAYSRLAATGAGYERAKLLRLCADHELGMAHVHRAAFGRDMTDDGIDLADSHLASSMLYRVLADVEHVMAASGRVGRNWHFRELGEAADEVLDRMAVTPDMEARTALLELLYAAVADKVGGQAAEMLWCLPSPGHSGWLTIAEKDEWMHERGLGPSHATMQRLRRLVGKG